jgi:hypothetical protein
MPILTPAPGSRVEVEGGTAARVIDLAVPHPLGGMDPEAPLTITEIAVTGTVATGHTSDLADPDAPILVREDSISAAPGGGALYAEGRCPGCIARTTILRSPGQALLVLEHEAGCAEFAALLAQVPR